MNWFKYGATFHSICLSSFLSSISNCLEALWVSFKWLVIFPIHFLELAFLSFTSFFCSADNPLLALIISYLFFRLVSFAFLAASLTKAALGLRTSIALLFLSGFFFWLETDLPDFIGLKADWTSLELMILARSGFET